MQTRYQLKQLKNKEQIAANTLIEMSKDFNEKALSNEVNNARTMIANNYCKNNYCYKNIPKIDSPYHGTYTEQIKQCIQNKDMDMYYILLDNRRDIEKIEEHYNHYYEAIINNITDEQVNDYLKEKEVDNKIQSAKDELTELKEIRNLKLKLDESIKYSKEMNDKMEAMKISYDEICHQFKIKYNYY